MSKDSRKPFILVILGTCGAGKTTLLNSLRKAKQINSQVAVHDMDEEGYVPISGRTHWRKYRVEELLYDAANSYQKGHSSIIGGWIWPVEILQSEYFEIKYNLHFVYLRNTKKAFSDRLMQRVQHGLSKKEYTTFVKGFTSQQKQLEKQVLSLEKRFVLDSTKLSKRTLANRVIEIIGQISE